MKFCRRTDGAAAARQVFKKARDDPRSGYRKLDSFIKKYFFIPTNSSPYKIEAGSEL